MLLGNLFTLAVGFPLQVFVARSLGAENLGIFSLFDGAATLGCSLLSFGLAPALVKFIPHCLTQQDHAGVKLLIKSGALILLAAGSLAVLVVWLLVLGQTRIPLLTSRPLVASLMVVLVPAGLLTYFLQQGLRGFMEVRYMMVGSTFLQLGIKALLAVLFLKLGFGLSGYVIAVVIAALAGCMWMALGLWRRLQSLPATLASAGVGYKKEWRNYAMVLYGDSMLGVTASFLDRFLLGWLSGAAPVGVLMLVKQMYALPGVFFQMFMVVASPMFSAAHARGDSQERQHIYHLIIDWVTRLSGPLCIFLLMFAEPVLSLFGSDFAEKGSHALRILVAAQMVNLLMGPLGIMLTMSGQERILLKLAVIEQIVAVTGLCLLVPRYGLDGVVAMTAFDIISQNIVAYVVARRMLGLRWYDRRYLLWVMPGLLVVAMGELIKSHWQGGLGVFSLMWVLVLFYMVFFAVSLLQGLHEDDRNFLVHVGKRIFKGE